MSNHVDGYILNHVLRTLDEESLFDYLGRKRTQNITLNFLRLSREYDCNPGEVLEGIGQRTGVCYLCERAADDFVGDLCKECHEEGLRAQHARNAY